MFLNVNENKWKIAREKWSDDACLYVALNKNHFFLDNGNGAETLASLIYLEALNLKFSIKFAKNVNEMSPSGNLKIKFYLKNIG